MIAKTVQGRPLPGIGSKRHGGGERLFCLHTYKLRSNVQEKKSLIYNYKVLPYTITPIANSDLVLWENKFFSYLFHEIFNSFYKTFRHSTNYRLPERRSLPTNATHHNLSFSIPHRRSTVNSSVYPVSLQ